MCVYIYIYICTYTYEYVCIHTHTHTRNYLPIYLSIYLHIFRMVVVSVLTVLCFAVCRFGALYRSCGALRCALSLHNECIGDTNCRAAGRSFLENESGEYYGGPGALVGACGQCECESEMSESCHYLWM